MCDCEAIPRKKEIAAPFGLAMPGKTVVVIANEVKQSQEKTRLLRHAKGVTRKDSIWSFSAKG